MTPEVLGLLFQIPLVGIFVWYNLENQKRQDARDKARDELFVNELRERDEQWRTFLKEQGEHGNFAIARIAEEVKTVTQEVARMNTVLISHDTASREARARGSQP